MRPRPGAPAGGVSTGDVAWWCEAGPSRGAVTCEAAALGDCECTQFDKKSDALDGVDGPVTLSRVEVKRTFGGEACSCQ